ncbi:MAG: NADH-quinone oxidoreductase subunit, partial [Burkholderiales bacterium]
MMDQMFVTLHASGQNVFGVLWPLVWNMMKIVAIVLPLMGCVAYLT